MCVRNVGYEDILPDGQAHVSRSIAFGEVRKTQHLRNRKIAYRHDHPDVIESRLVLTVDANVSSAIDLPAWFTDFERCVVQLESELFLSFLDKFFLPPIVNKILCEL